MKCYVLIAPCKQALGSRKLTEFEVEDAEMLHLQVKTVVTIMTVDGNAIYFANLRVVLHM